MNYRLVQRDIGHFPYEITIYKKLLLKLAAAEHWTDIRLKKGCQDKTIPLQQNMVLTRY